MTSSKTSPHIDRLITIMKDLRSEHGCPWDRSQTPESLRPFILEEAYELLEAIDSKNEIDICDEMGDLLLQIIFISQIYTERELFTFNEVAEVICEKMIRRHPHIFGVENRVNDEKKWEEIKQQERSEKGKAQCLKTRIPASLPALKTSQKIIKQKICPGHDKLHAEIKTSTNDLLKLSASGEKNSQIPPQIAKAFFALVQLASSYQLDAEDLLRQYNNQQIAIIDNTMERQIEKP